MTHVRGSIQKSNAISVHLHNRICETCKRAASNRQKAAKECKSGRNKHEWWMQKALTVDRRNETRAKRKQENDVVEAFDDDGRSTKRSEREQRDGRRNETRESKGTVDETKRERAKGRSTKRNESKTKSSERHSEAGGRRARNREDGMNLQKRSASETTCKCYISHTWHAVVHAWFPKTSCNIRQQLSCGPACVFKRTCYNLSSIQNAYRLTYTERKSHAMRMIYSVVQHFFFFIILEPYFCYLLPKTTIDRCQKPFFTSTTNWKADELPVQNRGG